MIESAEREMFINQIVDTSLKDNIKGSAIVMTFEKKPDVLEEVKANIISRIKKLTEKCCYETPTKAKIKKDIEKAIYVIDCRGFVKTPPYNMLAGKPLNNAQTACSSVSGQGVS